MKLKHLKDLAATLPKMLIAERILLDMEKLATVPEWTLTVDLLKETATHSHNGAVKLELVGELSAWMRSRLEAYKIPLEELRQAQLVANVSTVEQMIATDNLQQYCYRFQATSSLLTEKRKFEHKFSKTQVWRHELIKGKWFWWPI